LDSDAGYVGACRFELDVAGESLVTSNEFERSNLALELTVGKKRLELVLHGLTNEQCWMAGAVRSDSISTVVSRLISNEFLALEEVREARSRSEGKQSTGVQPRTWFVERTLRADSHRSIDSMLAEFDVVRSAIIHMLKQGVGNQGQYRALTEACVTRFNEHIEQIERWRASQLVGFSPTRLRPEALESELNAAILEIAQEHFLLDNFDLKSLFSESLSRYYSDEVVSWLGAELTNGRHALFQRLADVLEPVHTFLEMGMACVGLFRVLSSSQDSQGGSISDWEAVLGGPYSTGAAIRWRTVRVWKQRVVIAERIEALAWVDQQGT
jgi:hypothetical protein